MNQGNKAIKNEIEQLTANEVERDELEKQRNSTEDDSNTSKQLDTKQN